jgi:trans-2,3-dihydro-3-hydroxyanthranilate isomerase
MSRFRSAVEAFPALGPRRLPLYLYAHDGQSADTTRLRARMFSPLSGTVEDAATGSAATPLAALLLSLTTDSKRRYDITQGVEMGRPSLLACSAWRADDGIRANVGGGCVPVLKGEISL